MYSTLYTVLGRRTLCLRVWVSVPVPAAVFLPVPLGHNQGGHHSDKDGDGDDQHGGGLGHTQPAVHPGQRSPSQQRRLMARHVTVVVDVEVANV